MAVLLIYKLAKNVFAQLPFSSCTTTTTKHNLFTTATMANTLTTTATTSSSPITGYYSPAGLAIEDITLHGHEKFSDVVRKYVDASVTRAKTLIPSQYHQHIEQMRNDMQGVLIPGTCP